MYHSEAPLAVQVAEQFQDPLAGGGVEVAGRLVGQQDRRPTGQARAIAARCISPPEAPRG